MPLTLISVISVSFHLQPVISPPCKCRSTPPVAAFEFRWPWEPPAELPRPPEPFEFRWPWEQEPPPGKETRPPTAPTPIVDSTPVSAEGLLLRSLLETGESFKSEWIASVNSLGTEVTSEAASAAEIGTLQARMQEVAALDKRRAALRECMSLAVERLILDERLTLLPSVEAIAPGAAVPPEAATLVRVSQVFPGQSARQVRAFVTESVPAADSEAVGRFDRVQAAQLTMGCIQFGYFLSAVFRGQAHLSDDQSLSPEEAREIVEEIQRSTRLTKSEVAWAVASRRAGAFFGLDLPEEAQAEAILGYEQLRTFTTGVQVVGAAQQEEFFSEAPAADESLAEAEAADADEAEVGSVPSVVEPLPVASFVRFNTAGLQALLSEACLFGWHLWGAEAEARSVLEANAPSAVAALLTRPRHASEM